MKTIKELREEAEALYEAGVSKKEALYEALPIIIELKSALKSAKFCYDGAKKALDELSEEAAQYAENHTSVFDAGDMAMSPKGVLMGDITVDNKVYHLACGYTSPKRIDGELLTQDFLDELPETWVKTTFGLDTTGINREKVTAEELEQHGLYRPTKSTWSIVDTSGIELE